MPIAQHLSLRLTAPVCLAAALSAPLCAHLPAQDTRTVKEPSVPPTCVTLKAALTAASATSGEVEARADKAGSADPALDTARIQQAIDHCEHGHAVELVANGADTAFLIGPIALRPGVTLLVDKGVTLFASRNPEFFAIKPGSCGVVNDETADGCKPLISIRSASSAGIMGDGIIDGQGGQSLLFGGKPSFKSWWDLADDARSVGHQQAPRLIDVDLSDSLTLYRITLRNSPGTHLAFHRGDGLTVWAVKIDTPKSARNTDGIDPAQARNITIAQSYIRTGDSAVDLKAGDGPTGNVSILHNHIYWGRGVSIGGETNAGVSGVRVEDLSLDGTDFGLRITSNAGHGGLVEDVTYEDICIRDSKAPIFFDTTFAFPGKGVDLVPVYQGLRLHDVRIAGGGKVQFNGFDATDRITVALDGVLALDSPDKYRAQAIHTDLTFGSGPVNFVFTGDDSTVTGKEVTGRLPSCAAKFVPFP